MRSFELPGLLLLKSSLRYYLLLTVDYGLSFHTLESLHHYGYVDSYVREIPSNVESHKYDSYRFINLSSVH